MRKEILEIVCQRYANGLRPELASVSDLYTACKEQGKLEIPKMIDRLFELFVIEYLARGYSAGTIFIDVAGLNEEQKKEVEACYDAMNKQWSGNPS